MKVKETFIEITKLSLIYILSVELGVVIGKGGRDIPEAHADSHIAGYGECGKLIFVDNLLI